jgi:protein-tyrosine phosphatase
MSYQAHKIIDRLYQGGFPPPGDGLKNAGVDVIVLCAREWQDETNDAYPGIIVIKAPGDDDTRHARLLRFIDTWKAAAKQVVEHVKAGRNVLVTCMAGQNRSGIVTAMALVELTGLSGKACVDHVSSHRPLALNNGTFAQYVIDNFPEKTP